MKWGIWLKIDDEELALTLEGKKTKLRREHFERLGTKLDLNSKQIKGVFNRFLKGKPIALQWIENSFLSDEFKERYAKLLEKRYSILYK